MEQQDSIPPARVVRGLGLSLGARAELTPAQLVDLARRVEDSVSSPSLWLPEGTLRDPFPVLGYLAAVTERLQLGTGVSPLAARTPVTAALAGSTLDAVSGGRAILGLGVGHADMNEDWHGQVHASTLAWVEEYLLVLAQVLRGEPSAVEGAEVRSVGFELLGEPRPPVPVALAALGPRMLALAGRRADVTLLNWVTPTEAARCRAAVAAAAGGPVNVGAYVRVAAPGSRDAAAATVATFLGRSNYRRSFERAGLLETDDPVARIVDELVLTGSPGAVAERLSEWTSAGMDFTVLYPIGTGAAFGEACDLALAAMAVLQDAS